MECSSKIFAGKPLEATPAKEMLEASPTEGTFEPPAAEDIFEPSTDDDMLEASTAEDMSADVAATDANVALLSGFSIDLAYVLKYFISKLYSRREANTVNDSVVPFTLTI